MDWLDILNKIFTVVIFPLLGVLTLYLVQIIRTKIEDIKAHSENEVTKKYIDLLGQTITDCVIATNQTYVNSLKEQNIFDLAAQTEAFNRTYEAIMAILSEDAVVYLENIYGDLEEYIAQRIEAEVNKNRSVIVNEQG